MVTRSNSQKFAQQISFHNYNTRKSSRSNTLLTPKRRIPVVGKSVRHKKLKSIPNPVVSNHSYQLPGLVSHEPSINIATDDLLNRLSNVIQTTTCELRKQANLGALPQ